MQANVKRSEEVSAPKIKIIDDLFQEAIQKKISLRDDLEYQFGVHKCSVCCYNAFWLGQAHDRFVDRYVNELHPRYEDILACLNEQIEDMQRILREKHENDRSLANILDDEPFFFHPFDPLPEDPPDNDHGEYFADPYPDIGSPAEDSALYDEAFTHTDSPSADSGYDYAENPGPSTPIGPGSPSADSDYDFAETPGPSTPIRPDFAETPGPSSPIGRP